MFKILAIVGAIAGGTTYGLYAHTDLFKDCGGTNCPVSVAAEAKPCCQESSAPKPECCEPGASCCEEKASCCSTKATAAKLPACCASKTLPVSTAACCANPCPQCAIECSVCCGDSAKAAIAGPAAIVAGALKK
jgi:hypothetical protein